MAVETKTTSFQRLYPGRAGVCSVFFPFVISWEGTASLKCHVGQGSSPLGGFEQKLRVAISCFPQQGKGVGLTPRFWPELHFEKVTHEECEKSCIPTPVRAGIFPPHPLWFSMGQGSEEAATRVSAARPEAARLSGFRAEL